jgi:type II secretory pathway pseudopilin PulG
MSRANDYRRAARSQSHFGFLIFDFGLRMRTQRMRAPQAPQSKIQNPKSKIVSPRSGLTLIEMLMATAITLLMMAAIVNLFAAMTSSISNRRALIELNGQVRQVRQRLALDLAGCTVPSGAGGIMPWRQRPGEAIGYLEIVEGALNDGFPSNLLNDDDGDGYPDGIDVTTSIIPSSQRLDPDSDWITDARGLGDADDVLALTVRSLDEPFVANIGGDRVESNLAEVLWYAREVEPVDDTTTNNFYEDRVDPTDASSAIGEPGMRTIYRQVRLIAPWLPAGSDYDSLISTHNDPVSGQRVPNTLADLTRREFRAGHRYDAGSPATAYGFPHELGIQGRFYSSEHAVLNDALAFDVRVFDPGAPAYGYKGLVVEPGSPGWVQAVAAAAPIVGFGTYVDLGWDDNGGAGGGPNYIPVTGPLAPPAPMFQRERQVGWHPRFLLENNDPALFRGTPAVYDTWTWHYENDGANQDNVNNIPAAQWRFDNIDTGRDGLDNDGLNGVDDAGERETSPPYPVPLRGVKVILRTYERDARQVREVSVTNSFVP